MIINKYILDIYIFNSWNVNIFNSWNIFHELDIYI